MAGGLWFAWPAEWLGAELDSIALFELGDELVRAEGGIGAGGLAEGGGFAASEGALLPVRRGRPVPLELTSAVKIEWVQPSRTRREAEMCAGGRPSVVLGSLGHAGPNGVHFDVPEGVCDMEVGRQRNWLKM